MRRTMMTYPSFTDYDPVQDRPFLSVQLDADLKHWVRVAAAKQDQSISEYVRWLLERERAHTPQGATKP